MPGQRLDQPFRRRLLAVLAGVAGCSLALAVAFVVVQPEVEVTSSGADSFSRSALGHRAFVALLREQGVPVVVSRSASAERAGRSALLVVAEPSLDSTDPARTRRLGGMLARARHVLLVLPKWQGEADPGRPSWLQRVMPLGGSEAAQVMAAAGIPARLRRQQAPLGRCAGTDAAMAWPDAQLLDVRSADLRPLIHCAGGVLLGEMRRPDGGRLLVLADPDAIANHALDDAGHARLALEVMDLARQGRPVVVDEILHGHERPPVLWRELFAFPLLPAVLQAALALAGLVAAGLGRFGAPVPASLRTLGSGKALLIDNTASLLRRAGHSAHTLGRYLDATVADVARALHAPPLEPARLRSWLQVAARRRGVRTELDGLRAQVAGAAGAERRSPAAILAAARRIHRWREEMLSGPHHRPGR